MRKIKLSNLETSLNVNKCYEGVSIETKIKKVLANNEPIDAGAPLIFTERKDGVLPEYNVRTDKMDIAAEAMDKWAKSKIARRIGFMKNPEAKKLDGETPVNPSDKQENV